MTQTLALCIPAFNAARYLPDLLEDALAQNPPFDELWVYDDASTDDTAGIAKALGAEVVRGDANRGCSWGKNVLAERAGTTWIHFHDADDRLLPGFVSAAHEHMSRQDVDVVLFGYEERWYGDASGSEVFFEDEPLRRDAVAYALRRKLVSICGVYNRRAFLDVGGWETDPAVLYNEDVAGHLRMALAGLRFGADSRITVVNVRRRASMSSSNQARCAASALEVLKRVALARPGRYDDLLAERLWGTAASAASYLDFGTADSAAALAQKLSPPSSPGGSVAFRALCALNAPLALRGRELGIRLLKPRLREGYPSLRNAILGREKNGNPKIRHEEVASRS